MPRFALLLLVGAVALVSGQGRPNPGPTLGCTTTSFQMPGWLVTDLTYDTWGYNNLTFSIQNRATEHAYLASCWFKPAPTSGPTPTESECNISSSSNQTQTLKLFANVNEQDLVTIRAAETWKCTDRSSPSATNLTYTASGNLTTPASLTCELIAEGRKIIKSCKSASPALLIKGSLESPVKITPHYTDGVTGHNKPNCRTDPGWVISGISYLNQTGNGASSATWENLNLVIDNPAIGYQASCVLTAGNDNRLRCSGQEFGRLKPDRYVVETFAKLDLFTFEFAVNQTWYCDESDPATPIALTAGGSITLPIECETAEDKAEHTSSRSCRVPGDKDITLKGNILGQKDLPAFSIIDPVLTADGCTVTSLLNPTWRLNYFFVDKGTENNTSSVGLNIILATSKPGFGFPLSITQGEKPVAGSDSGETWYACLIGPFDPYEERLYPKECTLKWDESKEELSIKANWECSDLDTNSPIQFSGISTSKVDSPLVCDLVEDFDENGTVTTRTQCLTEDPAYSWTASIVDVKWI
ncbi:hypothetical protein V8F33_006491 [Rhypophila sp. PSN 637]